MRFPSPGRTKSAEDFREQLRAVGADYDCDLELRGAAGPLGQPLEVAGHTLANRFAIHPMEGWDGSRAGAPTPPTLRRWERFGRSGAALIWGGEAVAVQHDGRANPNQLFLNPEGDFAGDLAQLRAAVLAGRHAIGGDPDGLLLGLQLTHSGRFARPDGDPAPRLAVHHPVLDPRTDATELALLTDGELEAIGERFVAAAETAAEVGFAFVDVKCCHGYLLHELLGARARPGPYGGSFENRTRLFLSIVRAIRASRPALAIGVRVSLADVFPHARDEASGVGAPQGWEEHLPYEHGFGVDRDDPRRFDLEEPLRFLALLRDEGIELVNVSLGSPYSSPHLQRPAAYPPSDGYHPPVDPLLEVGRHLRVVREAKARFPELVLVGSGYSYLQEWLPHVAQREVGAGHVDCVGLGRMVLAYPELPLDVLTGRPLDRRRICRTFSDCTTGPRNGMPSGCYPLDDFYKSTPEARRVQELRPPR